MQPEERHIQNYLNKNIALPDYLSTFERITVALALGQLDQLPASWPRLARGMGQA